MPPIIVLFDLDGVLINPGGYRAAFSTVIQEFLEKSGLKNYKVPKNLPELFESHGVTNEWDMLPLTYAVTLDAAWTESSRKPDPKSFDEIYREKNEFISSGSTIDYKEKLQFLSQFFSRQNSPALDILDACLNGHQEEMFPALNLPMIKEIFAFGSDLNQSKINILFQNYVLGDQVFQNVYRKTPQIITESYLRLFDKPNLESAQIKLIKDLAGQKIIHPAVLTSRPSLAPKQVQSLEEGYSPETEIAASILDINDFPLIGYGRIDYIAKKFHFNADRLIKPVPFQALAAILAAWFQDELFGLESTAKLFGLNSNVNQGSAVSFLSSFPKNFDLHVYEDSFVGISSCQKALEILKSVGINAKLFSWGVAKNPEKIASLKSVGANIFENIGSALEESIKLFRF